MTNWTDVKEILKEFYDLQTNITYVFGSRANQTSRPDSDLDLLILDVDIEPKTVAYLNEAFEESDIPYKVDIILRSRIDDEFYEKIRADLIPI